MVKHKWIKISYKIPETEYFPKTGGKELQNPVKIYYPSSKRYRSTRSGLPLIIFSHGYTIGHLVHKFLLERIAEAGYVVAAISHRNQKFVRKYGVHPLSADKPKENELFCIRISSITPTIDEALKINDIWPKINEEKIGGTCVSLGNATLLGASGARVVNPKPKNNKVSKIAHDRRLNVVVGLSPFYYNGHLEGEKLPDCPRRFKTKPGNTEVSLFGDIYKYTRNKESINLPGLRRTVTAKAKAYVGTCDNAQPLDNAQEAQSVLEEYGVGLGVVTLMCASHREVPFLVPPRKVIKDLQSNM